jgi:hypothetical protein
MRDFSASCRFRTLVATQQVTLKLLTELTDIVHEACHVAHRTRVEPHGAFLSLLGNPQKMAFQRLPSAVVVWRVGGKGWRGGCYVLA